jgi:hypothetical protein
MSYQEQMEAVSTLARKVKQLKSTIKMWRKTVTSGSHKASNTTILSRLLFLESIKLPEAEHCYEVELTVLQDDSRWIG